MVIGTFGKPHIYTWQFEIICQLETEFDQHILCKFPSHATLSIYSCNKRACPAEQYSQLYLSHILITDQGATVTSRLHSYGNRPSPSVPKSSRGQSRRDLNNDPDPAWSVSPCSTSQALVGNRTVWSTFTQRPRQPSVLVTTDQGQSQRERLCPTGLAPEWGWTLSHRHRLLSKFIRPGQGLYSHLLLNPDTCWRMRNRITASSIETNKALARGDWAL